ncbi:MAG: septal ring lytic transglycosylase RlpA family protein [Terrimicrobiaceae bacterium]
MRIRLQMAAITALAFALLSADWLIASQGKSGGRKTPLIQTGLASWYGKEFKGGKTASGERYDPEEMTAAHRTLPFGTIVRVINLRNNKSVTVRITNRGPFVRVRSLTMLIIMVIKIPERDNTKAPENIRQTLSEE